MQNHRLTSYKHLHIFTFTSDFGTKLNELLFITKKLFQFVYQIAFYSYRLSEIQARPYFS